MDASEHENVLLELVEHLFFRQVGNNLVDTFDIGVEFPHQISILVIISRQLVIICMSPMIFVIEKCSLSISHVQEVIGRNLFIKGSIFACIVKGLLLARNLVLIIVELDLVDVNSAPLPRHILRRPRRDVRVGSLANCSRILDTF